MKKTGMILLSAALLAAGCQPDGDNNRTLEFETLDVNFTVKTSGIGLPAGTSVSIAATCARDGGIGVSMTGKPAAEFRLMEDENSTGMLVKASEADAVTALAGDHDFRFRAVSPATGTIGETVPVTVPAVQEYGLGVNSYLTFYAAKNVTTVIPDIELELQTPAAVLNLLVPIDIVETDVPAVLKSVEICPAQDGAEVYLAGGGTFDFSGNVFTPGTSGQSGTITVNFPEGGLKLEAAKTEVKVAVMPFEVPAGGFKVKFTDVDGSSMETLFLAQESDAGKKIAAGTLTDIVISASGDGVEPVTFPVSFPVSKVDGVQRFTATLQPRWKSEGYWSCTPQPQAYCEWHKVAEVEHPSGYMQNYEIVNVGNISTGGVKGVWTGDYFEFTIPVKKFAAGTEIEMKFPFYGRQEPVFWNIDYLDGEQWKTANLHTEVCYDGVTSKECTFSLVRGAKIITETLLFENEVKSGYLKIRIVCVDGSIQADTVTSVAVSEYPFSDPSGYAAPFYFWDKSTANGGVDSKATPEVAAVTFSLVN